MPPIMRGAILVLGCMIWSSYFLERTYAATICCLCAFALIHLNESRKKKKRRRGSTAETPQRSSMKRSARGSVEAAAISHRIREARENCDQYPSLLSQFGGHVPHGTQWYDPSFRHDQSSVWGEGRPPSGLRDGERGEVSHSPIRSHAFTFTLRVQS